MSIKKLKKKIVNQGYEIKIRLKKLKSGKHSIFLDHHYFEAGKEHRDRKFLKLYVTGVARDKSKDRKILKEAMLIRNKYEEIYRKKKHDLFKKKEHIYLFDWFKRMIELQKTKSSQKIWRHTFRHLKLFCKDRKLTKINKTFCENFAQYLLNCNALNQNSAHTYFSRFKIAIKKAYDDEIIERNYTASITIKQKPSKREYLTYEELKKVKEAYCKYQDVKNAFLFSCYTGLRYSDILDLTFDKIVLENSNYYVDYVIKKTKQPHKLKLTKTALKIYKIQKSKQINNFVFNFPKESTFRKFIKRLIKNAEINKHITFHCARHTFATLAISSGIDIYTLSKLLGHSDVKVTQIYANLLDEEKDNAVDKLPDL